MDVWMDTYNICMSIMMMGGWMRIVGEVEATDCLCCCYCHRITSSPLLFSVNRYSALRCHPAMQRCCGFYYHGMYDGSTCCNAECYSE